MRAPASIAAACGAAGLLLALAAGDRRPTEPPQNAASSLLDPREVHLRNLRQLTFGGENAEAYWSPDGRRLVFQSTREGALCDQIFILDLETGQVRRVSPGIGKATCAFFFPNQKKILFSSTHLASPDCPPKPDYARGYVWRLDPAFDIFTANDDGTDLQRLTDHPGYDAEATVAPDGSRIVFTSLRDGDLDLYTMKPDGTDLRRLTREMGYDGGAFYSRDGKRIVWRASRPRTEQERADYLEMLRENAVRPMNLEIYVANADGSEPRQVTSNGAANFAPYFFPDGRRILFASNLAGPDRRSFDLWMVRDDGTGLERVTYHPAFDGFPMFSPDGRRLVFASNRGGSVPGETNLFLADWVEAPEGAPPADPPRPRPPAGSKTLP
jgi:Tol biopolymer transport system component